MTVQGPQCSAALLLEGQQSSVWALEVPRDQGGHRHSSSGEGGPPPRGPAAQLWGPCGPQVSAGELAASCGRQRRCLRTVLSSSCGTGAPHVTQSRSRDRSLRTATRGPGSSLSPSQRRCWGWHPQGSPLRPVSSQVLRPPHTPSGNLTLPLEFGEQRDSEGTWAGLAFPATSH